MRLAPVRASITRGEEEISKLNQPQHWRWAAAHLTPIVVLAGCRGPQSVLDIRGDGAARIAEVWWWMFGIACVVFAVVMAALFVAARRRTDPDHPGPTHRPLLVVGGGTFLIVAFVLFLSERASGVLHADHSADEMVIRVTGWQWWWEVQYAAGEGGSVIATANEIHIPTGRRVRLELIAGDVIHSVWIPNLQGKVDMVPGRTNVMWIQADRPGISRGQCAEYCGVQHTHMALDVVAHEPAEFAAWLARERQDAAPPGDSLARAGLGVFGSAGCAYCHQIRGTGSLGRLGPDLTHLASRRMLASGRLENTPENLARWITHAQEVKPENRMPSVQLPDAQLRALVHYLSGLR